MGHLQGFTDELEKRVLFLEVILEVNEFEPGGEVLGLLPPVGRVVHELLSGAGWNVGWVKDSLRDDLGIMEVELVQVESVDAREHVFNGLPHEVEVEDELPG